MLDIDLKCFNEPWTIQQWRGVGQIAVARVACWDDVPIAMCVYRRTAKNDIEIIKVAVKPMARNRGIGQRLIHECINHAREVGSLRVAAVVPESQICPGRPGDLSHFFHRLGFRAHRTPIKARFRNCGEPEDGVVFSYIVPLK